jgi:predicted XRE-type DNA-binding protein
MKSNRKNKAKISETVTRGSGNVFSDLGFSAEEAAELKTKAELTLQISRRIRALGLTQVRAAERLGVSQPDVSKLLGGRYTGFTIDRLLSMLSALEVDIDIIVRPKPHRRKVNLGVVRVTEAAGAA